MHPGARAYVGVAALALVVGLVVGYLIEVPVRSGQATGSSEPSSPSLTEQVFQPPDASRFNTGSRDGAVPEEAFAQGALSQLHGDLTSCTPLPDGAELCEHGSEDPPPGVDPTRLPTVAQLRTRRFGAGQHNPNSMKDAEGSAEGADLVTPEAVERLGTVPCIGDGSSGQRVQAIYASAADRPNRYTEVLPLLQQYAADASDRINYAAGRSGQGRVIRYVTTGSPCVLDVDQVTLSPTGDDTFANTVSELRARGYSRSDRKYLVWVDAAVGICGIGHIYSDDRPTLDNANTRGNMFARADTPCWGFAELHELLHTFGAIQDSAPNTTTAKHCFDETDVMCYSDSSGATMRETCLNQPTWNVDCNLDDYFNAEPAPGSYLANQWNVARSPYLQPAEPPPPLPGLAISSVSRAFAGTSWTVSAKPDLGGTATTADFHWTSSRPDCRFDRARALTTRYWCPVTAATGGRVRAWLKDSFGAETSISQEYTLPVPASRRRVALSLGRSSQTIRSGEVASLRTRLSDAVDGSGVIGMPVSLYRRIYGRTTWEKIATRNSNSYGRVTFGVQPRRTTDYRVASGYTSTWASGDGGPLRILVR